MSTNYNSLVEKLKELFQMDQADLDFGIYRVMNAKRDEIDKFLNEDLLPTVRSTLTAAGKSQELLKELNAAIKNAQELGVDPDSVPKVKKLKDLVGSENDIESHEEEIFSNLVTFFGRYYDGGDFLSLRRYKKETFSPLPMNGEESKFHWANADQYYIKSAENFTSYAFVVEYGEEQHRIQFELGDATTEQNNVKSTADRNRMFMLDQNKPFSVRKGELGHELVLHFQYQSDAKKRKQKDINLAAVKYIQGVDSSDKQVQQIENWDQWKARLLALMPTEQNPKRTTFERYLTDYTAKNTFDYFIHKDLKGFLSRELDFYIKNELFHSDDAIPDDVDNLEQQIIVNEVVLKKTIAFKKIAQKVIAFLAQVEDFQKRIWLKKKFVTEVNYCVTLDRVPETLYAIIAENEQQHSEWEMLFIISEIEGYATPLNVDFLKANPYLIIDTAFFDKSFKETLLQSFDNIDEQIDGVICHSDNYQALRLLKARYLEEAKCVYIDPPYNTDSSSIPYKNNYRHSSWGTMMRDRLEQLYQLLSDDGVIFVSIDKAERTTLEHMLDKTFGAENRVEELIWVMNTNNPQAPNYSTNHEYVLVYAKDKQLVEQDRHMFREPKPGYEEVMELVEKLNEDFAPIAKVEAALRDLYKQHKIEYRQEIESQGLEWEEQKSNDPWKGLFNYNHAEYRNSLGKYLDENEAEAQNAKIWVWREGDMSMPATKQAESTRIKGDKNYRFYLPPHPVTGELCPHPKRGWNAPYEAEEGARSFKTLAADYRIAWGENENKIPQIKRMLHEAESNVGKSIFIDYSDGEKETSALFGQSGVFLAPKHTKFVRRFIAQAQTQNRLIIDCFGGSGSSADAVIKQNRDDKGSRKYILAEMGHHFDTILKPRILKSVYSSDWKLGKPVSRDGISHCLKYLRLESYEDALDNISLEREPRQSSLLDDYPQIREDYVLNYMLDIESKGSLMNWDYFTKPFDIRMKLTRHEQTFTQSLDVVETFNSLLGLRVETMQRVRGIFEVSGRNQSGQRVLILWRDLTETNNDDLDQWFKKQDYNSRDMEFDLIYVNGDNSLPNLRQSDETWKVQLIEEAFYTLMFNDNDQ
ncbi:site-specific DNA-methyltransferase [Citrobacter werkmanii]|nr:site-specific DNA-methyltransferase [Citrobacter werkmanii]MBJ9598637.1 site-specific DNA-methyltransferase [Citrobacter werkmanii]HEB0853245.1 site-specific DNA-methyltransferase [Citrobacter freundii]